MNKNNEQEDINVGSETQPQEPAGNGQFPRASGQSSMGNIANGVTDFGKGLVQGVKGNVGNPNKKSLATGVGEKVKNKLMNGQKKPDKNIGKKGGPGDKKKNQNNKNGKNDGQNNKEKNNGQNNKESNQNNTKKNQNNNKDAETKKKLGSKLNPLNRVGQGIKSKLGLGSKNSTDKGGEKEQSAGKQMATSKIKQLFADLPITIKIKVAVIVTGILVLVLLAFIILAALFGGVSAGVIASICSDDSSTTSGSTYNGADYSGSASETDFLCKMQNPLGKKFNYTITSKPGPRWGSTHRGIDLAIGRGTPIYAAQAGVVTEVNDGCKDNETVASRTNCGGESRGNFVAIKHGGVIETHYYHMVKNSIKVKKGDKVGKGQLIGNVASSGRSTGNHLHFGMKVNGILVYGYVDYFMNYQAFKTSCGSKWDGEPAGDSANATNDATDYQNDSSTSGEEKCCDTSSSISTGETGNYCPNGITVSGTGTISLEDYIAGVVSAENSYKNSQNPDNIEAMKAQAIAARTYAVNSTSNCSKSIGNSQSAQVYQKANERAKKAAQETAGSVMLYNGKVFSAQYDAFCIHDEDCPDASCSGTTCTVTYTKVPSKEKHKITVKSPHSKAAYSGALDKLGHAHGMSQYVARQMQDEGKKFDEILKYFYAEGIEITGVTGGTCTVGGDGYSGKIYPYYQNDYKNAYCSGSNTIATSGCGPTAMAIVTSSLLGEEHDPVELAKFSCDNGHRVQGQGTAYSFFAAAGKKYGLTVQQVTNDKKGQEEVLIALNSGKKLVIASTDKKPFTSKGHYIVLTSHKDGKVFVQDPNKNNPSKMYSFKDVVVPASKQYWIISKG